MNRLVEFLEGKRRAEVAQAIGISEPTLSRWLTGERRPSPFHCSKIEELTGIPRHELRPDIYGEAQ